MLNETHSVEVSHSENRNAKILVPKLKTDLDLLHQKLISWEEDIYRGTQPNRANPLRDSGINQLFSRVIAAVEKFEHYDCFSFSRAVLSELGCNVPVFKLPRVIDKKLSHSELTKTLEYATLKDPETYFAVETFQHRIATQGTIIGERTREEQFRALQNELKTSPNSKYLMIIQEVSWRPDIHIHGMIILGESVNGDDYWILHRNDTESPPNIARLSDVVDFWVNAYSSDRFLARLSLLLAKPIEELEPLPNPRQELIDRALVIGKMLDSDTLFNLPSTPYHGLIPYFTDCAKALIAKEPDMGREIHAFLEALSDRETAQQISAKLI